MSALSFRDFRERLSMEDILKAAGYRFNRRDGTRYPSYVAVDSKGERIKGDKFIVMPDRKRCFQPPFQQTYNVVSFIRSFPEKFHQYQMGMNIDRLVNLVCNRLLNNPTVELNPGGFKNIYHNKPFDLSKFKITTFDLKDWDKIRPFYPYFRARGIDMATMRAFSRSFILTSKVSSSGKENTNLSFPLRKPSTEEGSRVLGLELRSRPDKDGKTRFKGLAQGSEATAGLWMANPDTQQWKRDLEDRRSLKDKFSQAELPGQHQSEENGVNHSQGAVNQEAVKPKSRDEYTLPPLPPEGDIYWFESAYDAMAYYQLHRGKTDFKDAIFVSTSGNPSLRQFQAVMEQFPKSRHHLCFDNDMAGRMFTLNFLLQLKGDGYCTRMDKAKDLLVVYDQWKNQPVYHIPCSEFDTDKICNLLNLNSQTFVREIPRHGYKDWNDQLLSRTPKKDSPHLQMLQPKPEQLMPKESRSDNMCKTSEELSRAIIPEPGPQRDMEVETQQENPGHRFKL